MLAADPMNAGARPSVDPWVHLPPNELLATVQVQPVPDIPLASIRELLRAQLDDDGRLVDWQLVASGFDHHDAVAEFWNWRATWRWQWPIGSVAHLGWLLDVVVEIDHDRDDRLLDRLLERAVAAGGERPVDVTRLDAAALSDELRTVRLALSVDERRGWAIVDDMPTATRGSGLARTWVAGAEDLVLTGTTATSVVLRRDGRLSVAYPAPGGPAGRHADPLGEHLETFDGVVAADLRGDTVVVLNDRGASLRLTQDDARPLGWLVPRSLRWHVREIPLVAVWAALFDGLGAALEACIDAGEPVVISGETGIT